MLVRFWGVRGQVGTAGKATMRYGGHTPCVEVRCGETLLILDAGTGIRALGEALLREANGGRLAGHVLLTHDHRDHLEGFRFFAPALDPKHRFTVYGSDDAIVEVEDEFTTQLETKYFPALADELGVEIDFRTVDVGRFFIGEVAVTAQFTNHPGICYGYRLEWDGRSLVYLTDTEPYLFAHTVQPDDEAIARCDARLVDFVRGANLLIADAQFDAAEYRERHGWGHSSVDDAVRLALEAGVARLALFHHDPSHDDDKMDSLLTHARALIRRKRARLDCLAAQEGLEVSL